MFTFGAIKDSFLYTMPQVAIPITLTLSSLPNVIACSFTASPTCFITPVFVPPTKWQFNKLISCFKKKSWRQGRGGGEGREVGQSLREHWLPWNEVKTFKLLADTEETNGNWLKILVNELSEIYQTKRSFNLHASKGNKSRFIRASIWEVKTFKYVPSRP